MNRICKYCGKPYDGDPGSSCCPDCAAKIRSTTLRDRICRGCGCSFQGGPRAWYCPSCRAERKRESQRRFQRNGAVRKLGSIDLCVICGKPYVVEGGLQKYCKACAPDAVRAKDRAASLRWNRENTTPEERRETRQAASAAIPCKICGKLFIPADGSRTCSPECAAENRRRNHKSWEEKNKDVRNASHKDRLHRKVAAMTEEEYRQYRAQINARARENYRKRKERGT